LTLCRIPTITRDSGLPRARKRDEQLGFGGVDAFEQVAVALEEGAVDSGAASDVGDAELRAVFDGVVKRGKDALVESARRPSIIASTAGVVVVMGFSPGAGRAGVGGCAACRA
jgi:hypothetical protein